jgi:hypothetical protein
MFGSAASGSSADNVSGPAPLLATQPLTTQRRFNKLPPYTSADSTVIQKLVGQSV